MAGDSPFRSLRVSVTPCNLGHASRTELLSIYNFIDIPLVPNTI